MSTDHKTEPIAIVGSACRFPGGASSPAALWELLENPRDVATDIPKDRFSLDAFYHPNGSHHGTTNVRQSYLLQEDIRVFDSTFFNISPNEADSMDPQHRLILETTYEALESGGHRIEALRGSDTAVFTGTMCVDYNDTWLRDLTVVPNHFATGVNRAVISNRISYFFDWHGPSMTIDTACSSSLVAVHQAVQSLRSGESRVGLACGTQIILNPEIYIMESKLNMLSPTSRSRMWDASADGYARGEGVAAIVLKRLSDAIADGDHIECVIRETGSNQDGHSNGITVPSTDAQASLIRKTYSKAGLHPEENPWDRPQFFEAHGTGTKAGDPKEAAAIHQVFGQHEEISATVGAPLYVGSIKTVIGHLEGAAGLAGLLKASAMVQRGAIAPNMLFSQLNPDVEPFYNNLNIPTQLLPWPKIPDSVPRRVSVNSFGFGGTNAHAIIEEYQRTPTRQQAPVKDNIQTLFTPFVFSAVSEASLVAQMQAFSDYLGNHDEVNEQDLAFTLQSRRTEFSTKIAFGAPTTAQLKSKLDTKLAEVKQSAGSTIGIRAKSGAAKPGILGVFTGQGAQWPAMGACLIRSSPFVRSRVQELEDSLASLPASDRPSWSLEAEMLAEGEASRITTAALSQPLCTALQILLVDLLRKAGVEFAAVVGHSSGEIAAAYAAGFISATDAIRIAYYRGVCVQEAGEGAMLAVGTSWDDATKIARMRPFKGRIVAAAHNSSASVTMSGDSDAIERAKLVFDEEKKFARTLKVDKAYHSHHMLPCGESYIAALRTCEIEPLSNNRGAAACSWFSSVNPTAEPINGSEGLQDVYWRDNMANPVLFAEAVTNAVSSDEQIGLVLEVGPHPALKGPASQNIADVLPAGLPYSGTLNRGGNDVEAFSDALGFLWMHMGSRGVDFSSFTHAVRSEPRQPELVVGLPSYQWNHTRSHWSEPRRSRKIRGESQSPHELLGKLLPDSNAHDLRWTNIIKVSEIQWLSGHQLQGQTVFPAAGYVAMALEACRALESPDTPIELFELHDLAMPRAITFDESDNSGVETLVTLTGVTRHGATATAQYSCYALPVTSTGTDREMDLIATGTSKVIFGNPNINALPIEPREDYNMFATDPDHFYSSLAADFGYTYSGPFRTMHSMNRRLNNANAVIDSYCYTDADQSTYLVHPTTLDVAFQLAILAYSAPGDGQLWSLHVPTSISKISVNPELCAAMPNTGTPVPARAVVNTSNGFSGYIDLLSEDGQSGMVRIEDLVIKPFAPATMNDDRTVFTYTKLDLAAPDGSSVVEGTRPSPEEVEAAAACERISYYYHRKWRSEISDEEWANGPPHQLLIRDWVNHTLSLASAGEHPSLKKQWSKDTPDDIKNLAQKHWDSIDIRLLTAVGENMAASVRGETTILEHMVSEGKLDEYYEHGPGLSTYHSLLATAMKQVTHRYPHAKVIEIGAGTGGATKAVIDAIGSTMSSYTYTDISPAFFEKAAKSLAAFSDKMIFRTLDVEKDPSSQGYEEGSYDVAIAFNVLHATRSLEQTLANTRRLLKPGGYLMLLEFTNNDPIRFGTTMAGLPGWWAGAEDGRVHAPTVTARVWHSTLRKAGFSGVDTATPEIDGITWPISILVAQAVDDRVQFLRRPLAVLGACTVRIESLVILGTGTLASSRIAEDVSEQLKRFCDEIILLDSLPTEQEALTLSPLTTFLNLVDLDSPIFKGMTEKTLRGLQRMLDLAKNILWITQGSAVDQPYHNASMTFSRTVRREATHVSLNHLDVDDPSRPEVPLAIAEHLLQLFALDEWGVDSANPENSEKLLWSKEPEAYLENGKLKLPRLVANVEQNSRLNSHRRAITKMLPVLDPSTNAAIVQPAGTSEFRIDELPIPDRVDGHGVLSTVQSSTMMALHITTDTFLYLTATTDDRSHCHMLSLSSTNSFKTVPIASFTLPANASDKDVSADELIIAGAGELIADSIVQALSPGARLLVQCSPEDGVVISALRRHASNKGIHLILTCDADAMGEERGVDLVHLTGRSAQHDLQQAASRVCPTHFLSLAISDKVQHLTRDIVKVLPSTCRIVDAAAFFQPRAVIFNSAGSPAFAEKLEAIAIRAMAALTSSSHITPSGLILPLDDINNPAVPHYATTTVHWPTDNGIRARALPLDCSKLFSREKTYLLVGLAGEIGQSLCEFMVTNGAGCVCLISRRPKVDEKWLASFQSTGAQVKVLSMDVTDLSSVEAVVSDIRASSPPIAGVAHGANVLSDALFQNATIDDVVPVMAPKIDGANNLDQVFGEDDLDFFVLFSSVSAAMGNTGQSSYAAANGYLNGLARQRRRRGLAASVFDVGRVMGLGYIQTVDQSVLDQLLALGLQAISETDLRQAFAEIILMGFPSAADKDDIPHAAMTTGIRTFRDDEAIKGPWFTNPFFSHLITESAHLGSASTADNGGKGSKNTLRVGEQLSLATSTEEASKTLQDCFADKLRVILQIFEETLDYHVPIMELGIDSLVAVEVRSWFLKEIKVDIPVLKVIGGASLAELCDSAIERLPKEILSNLGNKDTNTGLAPKAEQPLPAQRQSPVSQPQPDESAQSSSAEDSDSAPEASRANSLSADTPKSTAPPSRRSLSPAPSKTKVSNPSLSPLAPSAQSQSQSPSQTVVPATPVERTTAAPLEPAQRKFTKSVPLSFGQSRYWFLHQLLRDQKTSNVSAYYHLKGPLRVSDMERATRVVVAQHESLRTCFIKPEDDTDEVLAYQKVLPRSPIRLKCEKVNSVEETEERFARLKEHEFDLASGELLLVVLLTLSATSHYLLVHHHHIIMDGVSVRVFLASLEKAYAGEPLGPTPRQYPDFSIAQRKALENGDMADELQYWKSVFPAGEHPPVLPLLPMARMSSRVTMKSYGTHNLEFTLDPGVSSKIRAAAKKQLSTPFHFYLATFQAMLFRLTDVDDITIGMADAARNTGDVLSSIGFFLNLLPLRFRRTLDNPFEKSITEARRTVHEALASSRLPFDVLLTELGVARSASHSPLFQAFIDYRHGSPWKQSWSNCELQMLEWHLGNTAYDITVDITDTPTHAVIELRVQKGLYDLTAAQLLLDTYIHLLTLFSSDPTISIDTAPKFSTEMSTRAVQVGRGPSLISDWPETLPHRIDQVVLENPDNVALMDGFGTSLTYASMASRIDAIAEALQHAEVQAGGRVLVYQQPAVDWVCSMLAIMRIGAVYVPMDLRNPVTRLAAIATDCESAAVLADASMVNDVPQLNPLHASVIDVSTVPTSPTANILNCARANEPAAIQYTSGSTGTPKGIVISHAGIRNEIEGYTKTWKLGAERVLQQSAFTFDFAVDEIYTGLVNGGMVYIVPANARSNPVDITEIIQRYELTYTRATPSEYLLWLQYGAESLRRASKWRYAFAGGEMLTSTVTQEFTKLDHSLVRLFNSYGPAETSISSCKIEVDYRAHPVDGDIRIPCGISLPNYHTYIVDEQLRPQPVGMPGEVCIGGAGVSLGYLNNLELTNRHFIPNPFATSDDVARGWTHMYRTCDVGHLTADGALVFHGRIDGDSQVKIRGLRIDLADIESNIIEAGRGLLREAVVTMREGDLLVAHVVFAPQHGVSDRDEFLQHLLGQLPLPQYMVPIVAIPIDTLPLTNHSKLDRKAVMDMPLPRRTKCEERDTSLTDTEMRLKDLWHEVLGQKIHDLGIEIGVSTNFFLVGGNSLLIIRLQARIQQVLQVAIPLVKLLDVNTLAEMAEKIDITGRASFIDWDQETAPPTIPAFLGDVTESKSVQRGRTIVVTGGTGFVARRLLPMLAAHSDISTIHCIAVREASSGKTSGATLSDKIIWHTGDLTKPLLGLSQDTFRFLATQVDAILHLGGVRAIWDSYHNISAINVSSTRELLKLAAPRHIRIHFISSVNAASNPVAPDVLADAAPTPSTDGADGYIASKWASERLLARAATGPLAVPCTVYRFLPPSEAPVPPTQGLCDELLQLARDANAVPDPSGWAGTMHLSPVDGVAKHILQEIARDEKNVASVHLFNCDISISGDDIVRAVGSVSGAESVPMLQWFGRIKELGFSWFIAGHDATVRRQDGGEVLHSRR